MVDITVISRRLDEDYFQQRTQPAYSYTNSSTAVTAGGVPLHVERARLTDLDNSSDDHTITITFSAEFPIIPLTTRFKVYRFAQVVPGKYRRKDVPYYQAVDWLTITGFEIEIEADEDLTGVIIEYKFEEI